MPSASHNAIDAASQSVTASTAFTLGTTKPSASNTGAGVLRAYPTTVINGYVALADGQNLTDTIVNGRLACAGNNLVENCVINNNDSTGKAHLTVSYPGTTIRFSTLTSAAGRTQNFPAGIVGIPVLVERCDISNACDGFDPTSGYTNGKIYGNYIHDLSSKYPDDGHSANIDKTGPGSVAPGYLTLHDGTIYNGPGATQSSTHCDCIQFEDPSSNIEVYGNFLKMNYSTTTGSTPSMTAQIELSCLMINDGTDLNIHHNWLDGNANMLGGTSYGINNGSTTSSGTIANNWFGRGWNDRTDGTLDAINRSASNGITYTNNVFEAVGDSLDGQAVALHNG